MGALKSRNEMQADMSTAWPPEDGRSSNGDLRLLPYSPRLLTGGPLIATRSEHLCGLGRETDRDLDPEGAQVLDLRFDGEQVRPLVDLTDRS
jgi:hypothetical protein